MLYIEIFLLVLLLLSILFGAHYLLYVSTLYFFSITNILLKQILLFGMAFFALSFIISSLVSHWKENALTRFFYFISGLWLGILTNLMLATIAVFAIIWFAKLIGFNGNPMILGTILFCLALVYSFYGAWEAFNPVIKKISVTIPDLPENWRNKKIVQISDMHLGHIYKQEFVRQIVDKINSINPALVVITGDLFDGMDGNLDNICSPFSELKLKNGIFFVTGNHETYLGIERAYAALEKTNVKIMRDEVADLDGLKLIGINYPLRGEKKDPVIVLESLRKDFFGKPNIFLYHTPVSIKQFSQNGINLQLSGHTHAGQLFPFEWVTKLAYKGYDYGFYQIGAYSLYVSSGTGTWGPAMRTGGKSEITVITLQ